MVSITTRLWQIWASASYQEPPRYTVADLVAEGDLLVALGEIMVNDKNGKPIRHAYSDVWRLRDGKLAQLRAFVINTETTRR